MKTKEYLVQILVEFSLSFVRKTVFFSKLYNRQLKEEEKEQNTPSRRRKKRLLVF